MFGKLDELTAILVEQEFEGLILESKVVVQDIDISLWEGSTPEWLSTGYTSYVDALQRCGVT